MRTIRGVISWGPILPAPNERTSRNGRKSLGQSAGAPSLRTFKPAARHQRMIMMPQDTQGAGGGEGAIFAANGDFRCGTCALAKGRQRPHPKNIVTSATKTTEWSYVCLFFSPFFLQGVHAFFLLVKTSEKTTMPLPVVSTTAPMTAVSNADRTPSMKCNYCTAVAP